MTTEQWDAELTAALEGTNWCVEWAGVTHVESPTCLANIGHRLTGSTTTVKLSRDVFRTQATRRVEILRQLSAAQS